MKNVSYVINGVLAVAIIILFVLFFTQKSGVGSSEGFITGSGDSLSVKMPVAYVNVDSLLTNYEFAKASSERLMNKYKSSESAAAQKQKLFQTAVATFQDKLQRNIFLSQETAQAEQQTLAKQEAELQSMMQRLQTELAQEEQKINNEIADSVRLCIGEYNKTAKYEIIFSNKGLDNILIAKDSYDVTQQVLNLLNSRYKAAAAAK